VSSVKKKSEKKYARYPSPTRLRNALKGTLEKNPAGKGEDRSPTKRRRLSSPDKENPRTLHHYVSSRAGEQRLLPFSQNYCKKRSKGTSAERRGPAGIEGGSWPLSHAREPPLR